MTILFLDQFNQPGGAQKCLMDLIPGVLSRGWKAVVMLPGEGVLGERLRAMGVKVEPVACGPYRLGSKSVGDFGRFLRDVGKAAAQIAESRKNHGAELIYVNGPRLVPAAMLGAGRAKVVFHCHSLLAPRYLEWITAIPLRMAKTHVIASSRFVSRPLRLWLPGASVSVIYNGVACSELRRTHGDGVRIGVIGRIAREKGQDMFLRAARMIPGCVFVICGAPLFSDDGYEAEVRSLAAGLPVEFLGWREDVGSVMARLDLLVVPSAPADATPRVILQAFAAKVPVVAFANEGFRELIEDGQTGYLTDLRTPEGLAKKIVRVLGDSRREQVTEAAFREWQARFSLEAYRNNILALLESLD
jgi:glycosyltransferase involved in cell wall biosynthesis